MSDIRNYSAPKNDVTSRHSSKRERMIMVVETLHKFQSILKEEFQNLDHLSVDYPNDVFPKKMDAISKIYNATNVLYKWYIEDPKSKE